MVPPQLSTWENAGMPQEIAVALGIAVGLAVFTAFMCLLWYLSGD
jgi:hypothetical protein